MHVAASFYRLDKSTEGTHRRSDGDDADTVSNRSSQSTSQLQHSNHSNSTNSARRKPTVVRANSRHLQLQLLQLPASASSPATTPAAQKQVRRQPGPSFSATTPATQQQVRRQPSSSLAWQDNFESDEDETMVFTATCSLPPPATEADYSEKIKLNIGGVSYRLNAKAVLVNGWETKLGRFLLLSHTSRIQMCADYDDETGEYCFHRLGRNFEPIYDFYVSGTLHVPKDMCFEKFMEEMVYWKIPQSKLAKCCSPFQEEPASGAADGSNPEARDTRPKDPFEGLAFAHFRRRLWRVTEGLVPSMGWKIFEMISTSFIVTSILSLILSSMPELLIEKEYTIPLNASFGGNQTNGTNETTTVVELIEPAAFQHVEYVCVAYFTLEYVVRLLVSPNKKKFVRKWLNLIDLVAILPAVFELVLLLCGITNENVSKVRWAFLTVRILRVIRMIRVVKLARFNPGVSNFVMTLERSANHMQMVAVVLIMVVMFFSTLIYFCEKDVKNTGFKSIPAAFWWCIVTMTTVGYGDIVPETTLGKIFSTGAILCGVLVLALPITIMVTNFMQVVKMNENKRLKKFKDELEVATTLADVEIAGVYGNNMV